MPEDVWNNTIELILDISLLYEKTFEIYYI